MSTRCLVVLLLLPAWLPASGQDISSGVALANMRAIAAPVAISGEPFGVLRAEMPLPPNLGDREPRVLVEDSEGRIFYPIVSIRSIEVADAPRPPVIGRPGGLIDRIRSAVRGEPEKRQVPVAVTVSALFRGQAPLDLTLVGDVNHRMRITPQAGVVGITHPQLLSRWWSEYTASAAEALAGDDFPKLVHKYLTSMLAARMELPRVDLDPPDPERKELTQPLKTLELLAAIEPLREEILEEVLNVAGDPEPATLPVPPEPVWEPRILPPVQPNVPIEALASRVPPECFYLRFGAFSNYVWFQGIAEQYGGDIAQSVLLRGFNYQATARMERMLATKLTAIAKMFGDQLISDMAVVGSDLYMKEGASVGVIFAATNPRLLAATMDSDRKAVLANNPDATLSEISIGGKSVSLLSTPDNRIRSFYIQDGSFLFISTSRTLVRRFLEVGSGEPSLSDSPAFRWARTWMPDANDYSVFAYFSPEFFHRLVSPQFQIELQRRLQAIAHIEIAGVAQQVAFAEKLGDLDLQAMQAAGLLSPWFDQRADGARTLRTRDGWIDSLRGARGSFLPIADVELKGVTSREAAGYAAIAEFYQHEWRHMDPMLLGLRRFRADGSQTEQVALEAYIAPFEADKYGWIAHQLGEPTPIELRLPADDAASIQLHVRGGNTLGITSGDYHLFAGVKDMIPPDPEETKGLIKTLQALRAAPAYIGGWPKPGIVAQLPLGLGRAPPDAAGFSRLLGGLWRWENGEFSLLSFDRSILENAIPQLQPLQANDLAQVRLKVADLTDSLLAAWINRKWYERGWRSSHGNARLLDAMHQQLKIPGEECLVVAERLFDVRLQCPLGGEYQFQPIPAGGGGGWWRSTAWADMIRGPKDDPRPPPNYSAPWIDWFRGAQIHLTQTVESLSVVGSIELERQPPRADLNPSEPPALPPMNFDLFGLPMKLFGGGSAPEEAKPSTRKF